MENNARNNKIEKKENNRAEEYCIFYNNTNFSNNDIKSKKNNNFEKLNDDINHNNIFNHCSNENFEPMLFDLKDFKDKKSNDAAYLFDKYPKLVDAFYKTFSAIKYYL